MASTYLTRTPSSAGNRKTWTWSGWVKRSSLGAIQGLFSVDTGAAESTLGFLANDTLRFYQIGQTNGLVTTQVFRDVGAWYHIVLVSDTTQSTESSRTKLYINGEQVTSFTSADYLSQNADTEFNTTNPHEIGFYSNQTGGAGYFDGYMAHVHFTDGYAYAASTFGSTATNGQWVPNLNPSVTYGTNGFFLKFTNASDLGEDSSGNNNDYTKSGSGDKVLDNPENVFATWNTAIPMNSTMTMAKGNLEGKTGSNYAAGASNTWFSTMGVSSGKWYAEFKMTQNSASYGSLVGVSYDINTNQQGSTANAQNFCQHSSMTSGWGYSNDGSWFNGGTNTGFATYTTNDIIGVALDLDNSKLYWSKNGTYQNSANPATGSNGISIDANKEYFFAISDTSLSNTFTFQANFGNPLYSIASGNADGNGEGNFEYAPPTGYLALCTNNVSSELTLPIGKGGSYMNTVLYTGNGTSQTITGVGFQPDFLWIKNRQQSDWHNLVDSIRGATKRLSSNNETAENDNAQNVSAFASDGFSVGNDHNTNANGENYVSWNWLGSNTTATNTDGSITTTVSANTTSGFSIVTFTSPASGSYTLGHGLNSAPDLVIYKCRGTTSPWWTFYTLVDGSLDYVNLSATSAGASDSAGLAVPTSTVFSLVDNYAPTSQTAVAYCFHSVEGYSKIGKYTGNGSTDGAFVYTGFRPSFFLTKPASTTGEWTMYDNTRDTFNVADHRLAANDGASEYNNGNGLIDFLSNGFKMRVNHPSNNSSGVTYLYMAFAENPFVDGSGVPVTAR